GRPAPAGPARRAEPGGVESRTLLSLAAPFASLLSVQSFVTVLLGNGDGTFRVSDTHQVAGRFVLASGLVAADFNGDGHLDLVETSTDGTVNVLRGNGDGTFHDPVALRPGVFPGSVAVGDFRGDGIPDLAVTDFDHGNTVSVLLGNGDGTFRAPIRIGVGTG